MDPVSRLIHISKTPSDKAEFESWLKMDDAVAFLKDNTHQNEFVVYASTECMFMHAVLVPSASLNPPNVEDLMRWGHNPYSSWGISVSFSGGKPGAVSVVPPLDGTGTKTLEGGEQLVFGRDFEGRVGNKNYYEVLQKFTHLFGLHFLESRSAYCRLDKHGDIEDVIRIIEIPGRGTEYGGTIITFRRDLLDEYMVLTDSTIVRMFDVTRIPHLQFGGWSDSHEVESTEEPDLFYRSHVEPGHASYMRGCQIVPSLTPKEAILKRHRNWGGHEEGKQYASFIVLDWKNSAVREVSCAPGATANYFTKSELPFETSPVFFRPEVLSKYKADSEKYRLEDRSITCRGAWHLQTYDINDAGQVHTYIVYLRNLPYEEQLYWKAYNEKPKGTISKRAYKSDFEASWDQEYDPLSSLKGALHEWNSTRVPWWTLRSEKLPDQVHYPVTASPDEWANEILQFDQLVVEGFETKWLRDVAGELGRTPDAKVGSIILVEECLIGLGYPEDAASKIVAPLKTLHYLRTRLKGHASSVEAINTIRKETLAEHGSYKKHFRVLAEQVDQSIRTVENMFPKPAGVASA
ncbi:MAG TPA: hypothetical protein VN943_02740 [Candidatus Acidoferrum sp.]|nr:hypothetical protein [Candidatus Acidoferrum sp.]